MVRQLSPTVPGPAAGTGRRRSPSPPSGPEREAPVKSSSVAKAVRDINIDNIETPTASPNCCRTLDQSPPATEGPPAPRPSVELAALFAKFDKHLNDCAHGKDSRMEARLQSYCGPQGDAASSIALLRTPAFRGGKDAVDENTALACDEMTGFLELMCSEYNHQYMGQLAQYWDMILCGYLRVALRGDKVTSLLQHLFRSASLTFSATAASSCGRWATGSSRYRLCRIVAECLVTQNLKHRQAKLGQVHRWLKPKLCHRDSGVHNRPYVVRPASAVTRGSTPTRAPKPDPGLEWWAHKRPSNVAARLATIPMSVRPSGSSSGYR